MSVWSSGMLADLSNYGGSLSRQTAIHILVGKNKTKLTCHQALLRFYSNYFDTMFSGFTDECISLPEYNTHAMKGFLSWVYLALWTWRCTTSVAFGPSVIS